MFFRYGSHTHPENEVNLVSFRQETDRNARGGVASTRKTLTIEGVLLASTQATISSTIETLEKAYETEGKDAGLYTDDGAGNISAVTPHFLDSGASVGGVKIQSISYPQGTPSEYATQRTFTIVLFADFAGDGGLVSFQESLSFQGTGGPRVVNVATVTGLGQQQITAQFSKVRIIQSGSSVGYQGRAAIPPPIFPQFELGEFRRISRDAPESNNGEFINWPTSWSYQFETIGPRNFSTEPHRR